MTPGFMVEILSKSKKCLLCESKRIQIVGMFTPQGGRGVVTSYVLCARCWELPNREARIERAIEEAAS
jgi:hypothetical protein